MSRLIIFNALTKDAIRRIVRQPIDETVPVELDVTEEAREFLVNEGYDPAVGAWPGRRAIQRLVANPLSPLAARNEIAEGDTVGVALWNGQLCLREGDPNGVEGQPSWRGARMKDPQHFSSGRVLQATLEGSAA